MKIPDWWQFALLALAAWRVFQLLAFDDILERPRRYITAKDFLECPFCFGAWIAVAWWGAWQIWPHAITVASVPFALSAALIGASKLLEP